MLKNVLTDKPYANLNNNAYSKYFKVMLNYLGKIYSCYLKS